MVEQYPAWRVQWQVFTAHPGMGSKKHDLTPVLLPCWRCYSHVGRKWLAVVLNALTFVCKQVGEEGSTGSTQGRASRRFPWGRGVPLSGPHASQSAVEGAPSSHVCGFGSSYLRGRSLGVVFQGFCGVDSSEVCSF
jgi:hypothetical protein